MDARSVGEIVFRLLPEVLMGLGFLVRRKMPDAKPGIELLTDFGVQKEAINKRVEAIREHVDFDATKRDFDSAMASCILTYVVLAFAAPVYFVIGGVALWLLALTLVKLISRDQHLADRYRTRRRIIVVFCVVVVASAAAKVGTVYFRSPPPTSTVQGQR